MIFDIIISKMIFDNMNIWEVEKIFFDKLKMSGNGSLIFF